MQRVEFQTERLLVRRLGSGDIDAMLSVYGDPIGCRWVGDGQPITHDACERWVSVTERNYQQYGYGMFAVEPYGGGFVVGFCGIVHPGGQEIAEIKYALHRSQWSQGLGTELASGLLEYAMNTRDLERVIATISPENRASIRIVERIGMVRSKPRTEEDGSVTEVYEFVARSTGH